MPLVEVGERYSVRLARFASLLRKIKRKWEFQLCILLHAIGVCLYMCVYSPSIQMIPPSPSTTHPSTREKHLLVAGQEALLFF